MRIYKNLIHGVISCAVIGLISCGGGGGGGSASSGNTKTVEGKALDDPIPNATVCLDKNLNGKCDNNEPYGRTNSQGFYKFEVPAEDYGKYPLIVNPDSLNGTTLITPPDSNYSIVSPFTALVYTKMYKDKTDFTTAKEAVESLLNYNPFKDYSSNETLQEVARNIVKVASEEFYIYNITYRW